MCTVIMEKHLKEQAYGILEKEFPRNVVILGDYKSSSTHGDSCKNNPLVLG